MTQPKPYSRGAIALGALAVGVLAFALRIALFRVTGDPVDFTETILVTLAVVATVVVLSLRRGRNENASGR